ncbi:MAG: response regulator [bacterium]|nr:response regulator [bacterium]
MIRSDCTKLNQILMNLVGNAMKFAPEGKAVQLKALKDHESILFQVIDQGIGIPPRERQQVIFEDFEQVDATTTRRFGGTGLGLAITKKMVALLGGKIEVESIVGAGSIFSVSVPLIESAAQIVAQTEIVPHHFAFSRDNMIVLVEDDVISQDMLMALFQSLNLELHSAANGGDGVQKILELQPDVVLLDMHMPDMDGLSAAKQIRANPVETNIPIIAISADAFIDRQQAALAAGISEYLSKPLDFGKLFPVLIKYLRQDQATDISARTAKTLPALPKHLEKHILTGFTELAQYSILDGKRIVDRVNTMITLCQGFDSPYPEMLTRIEDAAFNGDEEEFKRI